jgi:hypothetical protein
MCWPYTFHAASEFCWKIIRPRFTLSEGVACGSGRSAQKPWIWISRPSEEQFGRRRGLLDRSVGTARRLGGGEMGSLACTARGNFSFLRPLTLALSVGWASERLGRRAQSLITPQAGRR